MSVQRRKINMKEASKLGRTGKVEEYKMIRPMKRSGPRRNITNDDLQPSEFDFSEMGMGIRPRRKNMEMISSQPSVTKKYQPSPEYKSFKSRNSKKVF